MHTSVPNTQKVEAGGPDLRGLSWLHGEFEPAWAIRGPVSKENRLC